MAFREVSSDSRGFSVDSRASVFYGRDGRAPFLFLSASAALREVFVDPERRFAPEVWADTEVGPPEFFELGRPGLRQADLGLAE